MPQKLWHNKPPAHMIIKYIVQICAVYIHVLMCNMFCYHSNYTTQSYRVSFSPFAYNCTRYNYLISHHTHLASRKSERWRWAVCRGRWCSNVTRTILRRLASDHISMNHVLQIKTGDRFSFSTNGIGCFK